LLASDDLGATLARWRGWLVQAQTAGVRHSGGQRIADALDLAAQQQPERLMDALAAELRAADGLGPLCRWALATLFTRGETEAFARRLLVSAPTSARAAVALGLAATTAAWADSVLAELADDGEREVRAAVARAVGWGEPPSAMRVSAGLRACLPDDLFSVERLLAGLTREGRELSLDASALEVVHAILAATASAARPDGELVKDLIELCAIPRLAVEFLFARLNWLETEPANLSALLGRDGLPEELSDLARAGATDADVQALCERLDRGDSNSSVRDAIVEMLSWIDPGDALSDRIADWLSDEEGPRDRIARELLRETRDPERFRARAERLLSVAPELDLTEVLLDAREPIWMVGSEKTIMRQRADEFGTWMGASNPRLAAIGTAGHERYAARARQASGEKEDPDAEAG